MVDVLEPATDDDAVEPWRRCPSTWHFTRQAAIRARRRWLRGRGGRDAYLYRRGRFHWECTRIEAWRPGEGSVC